MSSDERESAWKESSEFIRGYVVDQVAQDIRTDFIKGTEQINSLKELAGLSSKELPLKLKMIGFGSGSLGWGEGFVLSDRNVEIDLEKIPLGVNEVEYIPSKRNEPSKLIYRFKNGEELTIESGTIDEEGNYINKELGFGTQTDNKQQLQFILGEKGKAIIKREGSIILSDGAQAKIGDRIFKQPEESKNNPTTIKIVEGGHFLVKNAEIITNEARITTSPNIETNIIFKKGDYSDLEQYVQIAEDKINMKGESINLIVSKDLTEVTADGNKLSVENGNFKTIFNGEKTEIKRFDQTNPDFETKLKNLQDPDFELIVSSKSIKEVLVGDKERLLSSIELKGGKTTPSYVGAGQIPSRTKKGLIYKIEEDENGNQIVTGIYDSDNKEWILFKKGIGSKEFQKFFYGSSWSPFDGQTSEDIELITELYDKYNNKNGQGSLELLETEAEKRYGLVKGYEPFEKEIKGAIGSKEYVEIAKVIKTNKAGEVVILTTGFDESYKSLPDSVGKDKESLLEAITKLPKKIELDSRLNLNSFLISATKFTERPHPEAYLTGRDLYRSFFDIEGVGGAETNGIIQTFKSQGFTFTQEEEKAFQGLFGKLLQYNPAREDSGIALPPRSKVYISFDEDSSNPQLEVWTKNKITSPYKKLAPIQPTTPEELSAISKYAKYSIMSEDQKIPKYGETINGITIKSRLDRLFIEFPNRNKCKRCIWDGNNW